MDGCSANRNRTSPSITYRMAMQQKENTYRSQLGMLITEEAERFYEPFGFRKDPICFMTRKETPEAITNE